MAFYNIREAAIQDPDNTGVDLDQVEKDVAGSDGIEAHRDEIDAAEEGVVGEPLDPVEEAFNIMYESEYNYNQILRCIGLHELTEASYGRELIFEATDVKGFFTKVKEFFVGMFEKITKAVKSVLDKMDFQAKADKKFVEKYETAIKEGAKLGGIDFDGYAFDKPLGGSEADKLYSGDGTKMTERYNKTLKTLEDFAKMPDTASASAEFAAYIDKHKNEKIDFVSAVAANSAYSKLGNIESESDFVKKLTEYLRGEKVNASKINATAIIETLKNSRETDGIRSSYKTIKASFNKTLKDLQKLENEVKRDDKFATQKIRICNDAIAWEKVYKSVITVDYNVRMKVARAKRAQCRAIAHKFASAYNKKNGEGDKKVEAQHNSAIFSGVKII